MHCTLIRITRAPAVWWKQRPTKPVLVEDISCSLAGSAVWKV
jgi:hypothetical protein